MDDYSECIACGEVIEPELYSAGTEVCGDCDASYTSEELAYILGDAD